MGWLAIYLHFHLTQGVTMLIFSILSSTGTHILEMAMKYTFSGLWKWVLLMPATKIKTIMELKKSYLLFLGVKNLFLVYWDVRLVLIIGDPEKNSQHYCEPFLATILENSSWRTGLFLVMIQRLLWCTSITFCAYYFFNLSYIIYSILSFDQVVIYNLWSVQTCWKFLQSTTHWGFC